MQNLDLVFDFVSVASIYLFMVLAMVSHYAVSLIPMILVVCDCYCGVASVNSVSSNSKNYPKHFHSIAIIAIEVKKTKMRIRVLVPVYVAMIANHLSGVASSSVDAYNLVRVKPYYSFQVHTAIAAHDFFVSEDGDLR